uniref:GDP-fucose protein O-fucosyltransferase 1 n=1 Tax=Steinernema glaseri TaxID=37863 RepID=A0A1I7YE92_9BILA
MVPLLAVAFLLLLSSSGVIGLDADPKGYVVFCPCMGRFGNQMEQFLGALNFAQGLDRTLVLPPLVEYPSDSPSAVMVEFDFYFQLAPLQKHHKVITMRRFMRDIAPTVWPKNERKGELPTTFLLTPYLVFCWTPRESFFDKSAQPGCHAKEGNPFGPFWDHSKIEFVGDVYIGKNVIGGYDLSINGSINSWQTFYPASEYPVLAFSSAPALFPVKKNDRYAQRYLKWTSRFTQKAKQFITDELPRPFIGIHLRNNVDWDNVCVNLKMGPQKTNLFASAQCIGYYGEKGELSYEMCKPSEETILETVEDKVNAIGAKSVFVASDKDHLIPELSDRLKPLGVVVKRLDPDDPHVSLAILQRANHFIGNCVSTFSSFVVRHREFGTDSTFRDSSFFGYTPPSRKRKIELSSVSNCDQILTEEEVPTHNEEKTKE